MSLVEKAKMGARTRQTGNQCDEAETWPVRRAMWFLARMSSHKTPYASYVLDREFLVHPAVFSPMYSRSTEFFAREIATRCSGRSFLEVGCGTGAVAIIAAMEGATRVVATDINPYAVDCAKRNAAIHGVTKKVEIVQIDDPSTLIVGCDLAFFGLPYVYVESVGPYVERFGELAYSVFDERYSAQRCFFDAAGLATQTEVFVGFSKVGELSAFHKNLANAGLSGELIVRAPEGRADNRLYRLAKQVVVADDQV